jgi:D-alanyl-D-alanine carboxypeptidase
VNNAGSSEQSPEFSTSPLDDIPEALRETTPSVVSHRPSRKWPFWWWGVVGFAIAFLVGSLLNLLTQTPGTTQAINTSHAQEGIQVALTKTGIPLPSNALLGHLPYDEAPAESLENITADGTVKLRRPAAEHFVDMANAARADGVTLVPLSGFRSVSDQEYVFFDVKAQQGEQTRERAEVSAPPGYSEHHTGYAIDLADGSKPETNLEPTFDTTSAFHWLEKNAARFNFELSFPKNNPQGVSYEPWHWRFVGDRTSLETFYRARVLTSESQEATQP